MRQFSSKTRFERVQGGNERTPGGVEPAAFRPIMQEMSPAETPPELDAEAVWRVFVDARDQLPDSELIDRDDWVQVRTPSSRGPNHNMVLRARLDPDEADARIAEVVADHAARGAGFAWIVSEGSAPEDLSKRLVAGGVPQVSRGLGMTRSTLVTDAPPPPSNVRIEPATEGDIQAVGEIGAAAWGRGPAFARRISDWVRRVLAGEGGDVRWWLTYLDDELVGSCTLRVLPGLGYLQGASVVPKARGHGLYRAMTWLRLADLHQRGIPSAVIWADERTSAPIARKMGFSVVTTLAYHEIESPEERERR